MARVTPDARKKAATVDPDGPMPTPLARVHTAIEKYEAAKAAVDAAVLKARDAGHVFSEIAVAANRSVSWVQSVVYRSDSDSISYQQRMPCPVCCKDLAKSWFDRHVRTEHPDVEIVMTPEIVRKPVTVS